MVDECEHIYLIRVYKLWKYLVSYHELLPQNSKGRATTENGKVRTVIHHMGISMDHQFDGLWEDIKKYR